MPTLKSRKLVWVNGVFLFLLLYIIAALVWWFISLQNQNSHILQLERAALPAASMPSGSSATTGIRKDELMEAYQRNLRKYISEGVTFFIFILMGAGYVFNAIRRQWKDQQQQQHFMMAITHELKTPIAVARLNLQTLQKHALDEEKKNKLLQNTLQEADRLDRLTNNILLSAQLEGSSYVRSREMLDLSALVEKALSEFSHRYPNREWGGTIQKEISINGDPLLLRLMVNNLLENAEKYSPPGTAVICKLEKTPQEIFFSVTDQGPGIPEGEERKIFQKFYRIGDEQTRKTKGTGLGLYLCEKIAKDHRAAIFVTSHQPNGSTFVVRFK